MLGPMCLTPECESKQIFCRGLCKKCYTRLLRRVQRGTVTWRELISQGLAKKASCSGASTERRQQGQVCRYKGCKTKNPYGLSDVLWASAVQTAKEKMADPAKLNIAELQHYQGILSLAGESDAS